MGVHNPYKKNLPTQIIKYSSTSSSQKTKASFHKAPNKEKILPSISNEAKNQRHYLSQKDWKQKTSKIKQAPSILGLPTSLKDKQGRDLFLGFIIFFMAFASLIILQPISAFVAEKAFNDPNYYLKKQASFMIIGIFFLIAFANFPLEFFQRFATWGMLLGLLLLGLILIPGLGQSVPSSYGKFSRWLKLGPIVLQPSEFCKISVVCFIAKSLYHYGMYKSSFKQLLKPLSLIALMLLAILFQPQYGTTLCILGVILIMAFVAGFPIGRLISISLAFTPILVILVFFWKYRLERLNVWLNPYQYRFQGGYQLVTSFRAFQEGGLWGRELASGLGHRYLTYGHTDFAFALYAENFGWLGVLALLLIWGVFMFRTLHLLNMSKHPLAFFLGSGALVMIMSQSILNLFVVTGILPTTGVGLPFLSYGGSSLISTLSLCGILLNATRYK